jgi:hypothetical protein
MFVRIIYDDGREVLRHCKEVSMKHLFAEDSESEDALTITCDDSFPDTDHVCYVVPKNGADIYFMNEQGQTVDSYQWIRPKDNDYVEVYAGSSKG